MEYIKIRLYILGKDKNISNYLQKLINYEINIIKLQLIIIKLISLILKKYYYIINYKRIKNWRKNYSLNRFYFNMLN